MRISPPVGGSPASAGQGAKNPDNLVVKFLEMK